MKYPISRLRTARRLAGFSLVEVTLAVGIMAFSLVGILGVLPLALNSGRQSFDQARASAIANTVFTNIRSQPFGEVRYLDNQFNSDGVPTGAGGSTLNLNALGYVASSGSTSTTTAPDSVKFYAKFLDVPIDTDTDQLGNQRRLCFMDTLPYRASGIYPDYYQVTLYFNNQPDGTIVPSSREPARVGQANRITMVVSSAPTLAGTAPLHDPYRFVTTVANRLN